MAVLHGQQNTLCLPRTVELEMSRHMYFSLPQEACGVVLGESTASGIRINRYQPIRNAAPDPLHQFLLDQKEWIQLFLSESTVIGIFHTHPHTLPVPSQEDLRALPNFAGILQTYLIGAPDLSVSASNEVDRPMLLNAYRIISISHEEKLNNATTSHSPLYNLAQMPLNVT